MYWLYFARDFYRTAQPAPSEAAISIPSARVACVVVQNPAPVSEQPALRKSSNKAKRQMDYVVKSEPVEHSFTTTAPAPEPSQTPASSPLQSYMQRLSVEGEHAFGVWDEEAGFSMFSANFERVTGLSTSECAGHEWIHHIHHTEQYALNEALLNACEGHAGKCLVQSCRLKEGAETRWLMIDIKPNNREVMVLFRDLTEQKALELALEQTQRALAVSDRSRAAFLSSMSHELRTPLNAIMGFSEMMRACVFGELGNKTYHEYAKHIHESGATLLTKINDLLDIASMDAGGLNIEESRFLLPEMLSEASEMHSHSAFERKQRLKLDCPYAMEIVGDRSKLLCATAHLIANASRHSPEGVEIELNVRVHDEHIIISVRDSGEGIGQEQLAVIREALAADIAYFKIESGGIGLGLSLSKELLQRHGGRVMIDSVKHRGTVTSLMLPLNRVVHGLPPQRKRSSNS